VEFSRIVQAEQAAIHATAGRKFRQHRRQVAPCALHSARRIQFWEEANDHALSLPSAAPERKTSQAQGYFNR
jgi:hypothetical protein